MREICPMCKAIAEYNAYYGRLTCTKCNWESKKTSIKYIVQGEYARKIETREFVKMRIIANNSK